MDGLKTIELEAKKYVKLMMVDDRFLSEANAPEYIAEKTMLGMTSILIEWKFFGKTIAKFKWPATWWDAFKDRWYPQWARDRWPVRYKGISIDQLAGMRVEVPPGAPVRYVIMENPWALRDAPQEEE